MSKKRIDILLQDFGLNPRSARARMRRIAQVIRAEWVAEARAIKSARMLSAYIKSVEIVSSDRTTAIVAMPARKADRKMSALALIAEFGQPAHDVRDYLLRPSTRNFHQSMHGGYVNVPFGRRVAEVRAQAHNAAGVLRELRSDAFSHTHTRHDAQGKPRTAWGARLDPGKAPKLRKHHAADALAGLVKLGTTHSTQGGVHTSGYRLWRRASWNASSAEAWQVPAKPPHHIANKVKRRLPRLLEGFL